MLITDQYGNYVTQHVIMHGKPEDRSRVISIVTKELFIFSKHKFASNVVEKCIEQGTPEELRRIREGLSKPGDDLSSPLPNLIKNQFGNYVIRKSPFYILFEVSAV
jgi:mRNA-binding protein PUF3